MNVQRTVLFGALSGAVAVWLASAATSTSPAPLDPVVTRPSATDVSGAALAQEIERLHERLRPTIAPTESRDLFHYSARSSRRASADAPAPVVPAVVAPPAVPAYALIGLAEEASAAGPVLTAIVSGQGQLLFLRAGDAIGDRYRVDRIDVDAVDLQDLHAGTTLRLALK